MEFRIADTFTESLARLTGDEQKVVKTTAFDLQMNPCLPGRSERSLANPGMQFHRIDKAKDKHFWSVRAGRDIRVIVHKTDASLLLCYVNHHDKAYEWAERRKLERHPTTGAAQIVEIREMVREVMVPVYVPEEAKPEPSALLFANTPDETLLQYGVPKEWVEDVKQATEDSILELADRLPSEAAQALLELATGGAPEITPPVPEETDPFEHPDAQRRFRVMSNVDELEQALDYPWDKWIVFLHPAQRKIVEGHFNGPARVSGSAGTGKTIVALHRAVHLARANEDARVLLTTFSDPLANALRSRVRRLISSQPMLAERLEVLSVREIGLRLAVAKLGKLIIATDEDIQKLLKEFSVELENSRFTQKFLWAEWSRVVDAWQLSSWEEYRDVRRLGRRTRLAESQRELLWGIFDQVCNKLTESVSMTFATAITKAGALIQKEKSVPFDFVVVDEAQDMGVPELKFLSSLGGERPDGLFFAGDLGQRIFQQSFSWKSLGVDVRGRSQTLRVNYRTSHQIRQQADKLLPQKLTDFDGNEELRSGTVSVFNGVKPIIEVKESTDAEISVVANWIKNITDSGYLPHEIGVFVRSQAEISRAVKVAERAGLKYTELGENVTVLSGHVAIGTMHVAKGLEFRAVVVMACDDEVLPLQARIESVGDMADLEDVYNTERYLLYVACTRARDQLLVTAVDPPSEFLDDLKI